MRTFCTGMLCLWLGCATVAYGANVRFNITGIIKNAPCIVTVVNQQSVSLGTFSTGYLDNIGKITPLVPFYLTVDNCPQNYSHVQVVFTGDTVDGSPSLLALQPRGATNVGVVLYDSDKTSRIGINTASSDKTVSTGQPTILTFYAAYQSTGAVTEGKANADLSFTLSYN